jgi:hypothetical protein
MRRFAQGEEEGCEGQTSDDSRGKGGRGGCDVRCKFGNSIKRNLLFASLLTLHRLDAVSLIMDVSLGLLPSDADVTSQ